MSKKNKLVPKLRFPEFKNSDPWETLPIGDKIDLLSGYPFSSSEISEDSNGTPLLRGINITEGYVRHSKDIDRFFLGKVESFERYKLQEDDLVIGMDGSKVGKNSALITEQDAGSLLIQRVARLRAKSRSSIQFIFQLINSIKFHSYVDKINTSGGIPHISAQQIKDFEIPFPHPKEQQKIADCLSSLDDVITGQSQKLEALKEHKKGLMQQLFPAEGEAVPRLRFKEFRDSEEWEIIPLGDVAENLDFKRVPITESERTKGDIPYYGASGIIDYVKDFIFNEELLCISEDGANLIARTYPIAFSIKGKTWVNNHAHVLKFKNLSTQILVENYLNYTNLQDYLTGMAQPKLNRSKLDIIPIPLPKPNEQQKVADFLSALDELITAQREKIDGLKEHKKGLMQSLFPNVDEL